MQILKIHDNQPDEGFCTMECEFTQQEVNFFIEYAVNDILKKHIVRMENELRSNRNKKV